jgi:hypothetical protein
VEWVVFVDDDVRLPPNWRYDVVTDLEQADQAGVDGVQGRLTVPWGDEHARDTRPDDWTRATLGLQDASWVTADMAYRRSLLERLGGFDERFPRAYREDADLALRALASGALLVRGEHAAVHPVRPAGPFVSVSRQSGNADDALMRRVHGTGWRIRASAHPGTLARHVVTTAVGIGAVAALGAGRRRLAVGLAASWAARTLRFTAQRVLPGPRTLDEVGRMAATSALIPPAAVAWRLVGEWRHRRATPWPPQTG